MVQMVMDGRLLLGTSQHQVELHLQNPGLFNVASKNINSLSFS